MSVCGFELDFWIMVHARTVKSHGMVFVGSNAVTLDLTTRELLMNGEGFGGRIMV